MGRERKGRNTGPRKTLGSQIHWVRGGKKKNNNKKTRATRSATIVEAASINSVKVGSHATERN